MILFRVNIPYTDIIKLHVGFVHFFQPHHEKKKQCGFRIGPTQTELYKHRSFIEAANFGF